MGSSESSSRWRRGLVVLRVYVGLVFLSNGLAKLFGLSSVTFGPGFRAGLIDTGGAQRILQHAASMTAFPPLGHLAAGIAGAFTVFGPLLTVAELALGTGMLAGVLVRWAAIGGLVLLVPVWVMTWPTGGYLWDYPADLVPLLILAVSPVPSRAWTRLIHRAHRPPVSNTEI